MNTHIHTVVTIIETNFYDQGHPSGFRVMCTAKGWPETVSVAWRDVNADTDALETERDKNPRPYEIDIESSIMFQSQADCATSYRCTVRNGVGREVSSVLDACTLESRELLLAS